ncbi:MAG: phosphoglucosamine mutase [bacterium]|nr:phosphoglucosamine mutase [bacterium]
MTELFGTDGIRGHAYDPPLDEDSLRRLGVALADELGQLHSTPELLLAGDTRFSTPDLASWLAESFVASGGRVTWGGVLPTPAVSHLLRSGTWSAGVVISASHNPAEDNGVKVLGRGGEKVADETERRIEARLPSCRPISGPSLPDPDTSLSDRYLDLIAASHSQVQPLTGLHIVVDCANGAGSQPAPTILQRLGARVTAIECEPDGHNINAGCGATQPNLVADTVQQHGADAGVALDGDADRAILADEQGNVLDGDDILLMWGQDLNRKNKLPGNQIVATVMSNFGLETALAKNHIELQRCPVGDRSVWTAMRDHNAALGGEQSGHIICAHHSVTGDGLLTATHILAIAAEQNCPLSSLSRLERVPQVLLSVPVRTKPPFQEVESIGRVLDRAEQELEGRGRILLRYSGTEWLARVMVEGEDQNTISHLAERLAEEVAKAIG